MYCVVRGLCGFVCKGRGFSEEVRIRKAPFERGFINALLIRGSR